MDLEIWMDKGVDFIVTFGPKLIGALLVWIIGSWVIGKLVKVMGKAMTRGNYDPSLHRFLSNLLKWGLNVLLLIAVLGTIGVETTSLAAVLAAAGLAIGLALQGSLANFAGGVLIMIFRPFKIGDLIEAQGVIGVVKKIEIFTTLLSNAQNKLVIVPNGALSNGNITNYSAQGKLRVDHVIGVGYDTDMKKAKEVLLEVLKSQDKVLTDPAPSVNVYELADSSINLAVRPWASVADYWDVYFDTLEKSKVALDAAGIEIPYPTAVEITRKA